MADPLGRDKFVGEQGGGDEFVRTAFRRADEEIDRALLEAPRNFRLVGNVKAIRM